MAYRYFLMKSQKIRKRKLIPKNTGYSNASPKYTPKDLGLNHVLRYSKMRIQAHIIEQNLKKFIKN